MPYIINKTDGTILVTVGDGTINNSTTSLTLIGKNYDKYGEPINENFVRLLENFANNSAPGNPLAGQLWWDSFNTQLKVYTGVEFKPLSKIVTAAAQPANNKVGDFWWDAANNQLKIYNGTSFTIVGPETSSVAGDTGARVEQIFDNFSVGHFVVTLYSGTIRVAVVSSDPEFIPLPALDGFASIRPGINLASGFQLIGTATNSDRLDNLDSTDFLRANVNATTSGTLGVLNDTGLAVGVDSDFKVSVTGSNVIVENQTTNGNLNFRVAGNASPAISVNGTTGLATVLADPTTALGIATKSYTDNVASALGALNRSGTNTITGVITPNTTATINFGSTSNRFATVFATTFDGNVLSSGTSSFATANITTANITTANITTANVATTNITSLANISATTSATSTTTGALRVAGGVGVAGNVFAGGSVRANSVSFGDSTSQTTAFVPSNIFANHAGTATNGDLSNADWLAAGWGSVFANGLGTRVQSVVYQNTNPSPRYVYISFSHTQAPWAYLRLEISPDGSTWKHIALAAVWNWQGGEWAYAQTLSGFIPSGYYYRVIPYGTGNALTGWSEVNL